MFRLIVLASLIFLCLLSSYHVCAQIFPENITVAQDGTGQFRTIGEAIEAAPNNSEVRFYIKIKAGVYRETIRVGDDKTWLALIGEGASNTIIKGNRSVKENNISTYETAIVGIRGHQFLAIDLTFENDARPENMQAVAMRSEVQSTFYRCNFVGYQDTLYAARGRQFYRDCTIYGTVDFIFGNAMAVFQKCTILVRKPLQQQYNTITAQSRTKPHGLEGTIFHDCYIIAASDLNMTTTKTYLGRNWSPYSRVVIMQTNISYVVDPKGWTTWDIETQTDKLFYAEYANTGLGAATDRRPTWVKKLITSEEAKPFTVRRFIQGNEWIPREVPFIPDLI